MARRFHFRGNTEQIQVTQYEVHGYNDYPVRFTRVTGADAAALHRALPDLLATLRRDGFANIGRGDDCYAALWDWSECSDPANWQSCIGGASHLTPIRSRNRRGFARF